jgi:glycosyltransferase involved in cell wall biosynthesis
MAHREMFDVLHVYHESSMFFSHYLDELMHDIPVVYTLHDPLPPKGTYEFSAFSQFKDHNYVSISNSFRQSELKLNFVDTVYHGIKLADYPFNPTPDNHLLFLGRLVPEKGLHNAIAAVGITGDKLTVSVNLPKDGEVNEYYEKTLKRYVDDQAAGPAAGNPAGRPTEGTPAGGGPVPLVTRDLFTILPVVDKKSRIELYRNAKALLFPIEWEEPFGVVLVEAMATGTPVIAFNRGSVSEIVKDGVTGFIIEPDGRPVNPASRIQKTGIEGLVEAIRRIGEIDRADCRKHMEDHFTVTHMVEGYERVYTGVLNKGGR